MLTFGWREHAEIACEGMAEVYRTLYRRGEFPSATQFAHTARPWCRWAKGEQCRRCPVNDARE